MQEAGEGFQFTDDAANKIGMALQLILEKHGKLTPEIVLEETRSEDSPLRRYLKWDDTRVTADRSRFEEIVGMSSVYFRMYPTVEELAELDKEGRFSHLVGVVRETYRRVCEEWISFFAP